jgi:sulfate adenylyltransferase subunit 2
VDTLDKLEEESIFILREAVTSFHNVAGLWSMGKDSTVMLWLARKAFLGKVPFPLIYVDNGADFKETYDFRDEWAKKWNLNVTTVKSVMPKDISHGECCAINKADAVKKILNEKGYTALIVSIRRDEHPLRGKERYMSKRDKEFKWDYKNQSAELWNTYATNLQKGEHARIHPLLDWTEQDVWQYIKREKIPINPLYFSRFGFRYRSLGCKKCSVGTASQAKNVDDIIKELKKSKDGERAGRSSEKEKAMQSLRALGYM